MTATPATVPALSTEFVYSTVTVTDTDVDTLITFPVYWAFLTTREARPVTGDWKTGSWTPVTVDQPYAIARCLVGPSGGVVTLTPESYHCWVKITGDVEVPVRSVGVLQVT